MLEKDQLESLKLLPELVQPLKKINLVAVIGGYIEVGHDYSKKSFIFIFGLNLRQTALNHFKKTDARKDFFFEIGLLNVSHLPMLPNYGRCSKVRHI